MYNLKIHEPWSAFTHFVGMILALAATAPLLVKSTLSGDMLHVCAMAVFMLSMVLLYAASASYHAFGITAKLNSVLKRIDHMMIPILIAGTYTPICLITLKDSMGPVLFTAVWTMALISIFIKAFWVYCPKWVSSVLYIAMGWLCVIAMSNIVQNLPGAAFFWLLTGGLMYTAGGVIYAMKFSKFNEKHKAFGSHEIFHLFVMAGSVCHYIAMFGYVG